MNAVQNDEFYVGYLPEAPARTARFVRGVVAIVVFTVLAVGAALVTWQSAFSKAVFEFGVERDFQGVIELEPYPLLVVDRPEDASTSRYLLTVFGKFGAGPAVEEFAGRRVRLRGALIYRDDRTMIELVEGSIEALEGAPVDFPDAVDLGEQTLIGEIVDSKCFLGVMKPGNLKPHRACATRCISGGVPPVFLVRDEQGRATYYLLTDRAGGSVNDRVLDRVAERLEIRGRVQRRGDLWTLASDPSDYRRVADD